MREVIFDTETTGLSHVKGDRVIEIGAVEMINKFPTGNFYHQYINPDGHPIDPDAEKVHGISAEFLGDKPVFADAADRFLEFFSNARLVAHNAKFDIGFLNAELKRLGKMVFSQDIVIDTLEIARRKHPMGPNSLDALCKRYNIDNSRRTKHGALLDCELLAEVYIELLGGKQASLLLANKTSQSDLPTSCIAGQTRYSAKQRPFPLAKRLTEDALESHRNFVKGLGENAIWKKYEKPPGHSG